MSDLAVRPRWWRLDPQSRVELQWGDATGRDLDDFTAMPPRIIYRPQQCISLRPYRDVHYFGNTTRIWGAWEVFDLPQDRSGDGSLCGRTVLVDGEAPRVEVFALQPSTVGDWFLVDDDSAA